MLNNRADGAATAARRPGRPRQDLSCGASPRGDCEFGVRVSMDRKRAESLSSRSEREDVVPSTTTPQRFWLWPPFWLWPMAVPVLPVLLAVALLELGGAPASLSAPLSAPVLDAPPTAGHAVLRHAGDRVVYAGAMAVHTVVSVCAIAYFALQLIRVGGDQRRLIAATAALVGGGVLTAMALLPFVDPLLAVYEYSYFAIADLLARTPAAADLLYGGNGVPTLAIWVLYPAALGIAAVVMASGVACATLRRLGATEQADGPACAAPGPADPPADFARYVRILMHCFYALSGVLVSSSSTALLFFHLPVGLADAAARASPEFAAESAAVATYAGTIGTFWGTIYTLTLLSVFAGPAAAIWARTHQILAGRDKGMTVSEWLSENGIKLSLVDNIKNVFVLIAPLLVGPLGELVKLFGN